MPDPLIGNDEIEGQNKNTTQRIQPTTGGGNESGRYRWAYALIPIGLALLCAAMYWAIDVTALPR